MSEAHFDVCLYNSRGAGLSSILSIYKGPGSLPNMNGISWNFKYLTDFVYYLTLKSLWVIFCLFVFINSMKLK